MKVGESWAYRVRDGDLLVEVRVLRLGTRRPPRVRIRFVRDEFEGREEWVPRSRLKCRWSEHGAFLEAETRWNLINEPVPADELPAYYGAMQIFDELIDQSVAVTGRNSTSGASWIYNVDHLANQLALTTHDLESDVAAFRDGPSLVVPWRVTSRIAERAARLHPNQVLTRAQIAEKQYHDWMRHGRPFSASRYGGAGHVEAAQFVRELDQPDNRPCWQQLRSWCGVENAKSFDQAEALRRDLQRIVLVSKEAAALLRGAGKIREAARIERLLLEIT